MHLEPVFAEEHFLPVSSLDLEKSDPSFSRETIALLVFEGVPLLLYLKSLWVQSNAQQILDRLFVGKHVRQEIS